MRVASLLMVVVWALGCSSGSANGKGAQPEAAPPTAEETEKPAPADERVGLKRDAPLPALAAKVMRTQMGRHAQRMEGLQWSALMLNYDLTRSIASSIADEPRIAKPSGDDDTLNRIIPPRFYELQDDLHASAGELAKAAEAKDDAAMTQSYAKLTKTCIRCHSLYLRIPGQAPQEAQ